MNEIQKLSWNVYKKSLKSLHLEECKIYKQQNLRQFRHSQRRVFAFRELSLNMIYFSHKAVSVTNRLVD